MKPPQIGTILPDRKALDANDRHMDRIRKQADRYADGLFIGCSRRIVGGETRYYETADRYAVVTPSGRVLWFRVTADGDYAIRLSDRTPA